MKFLSNQEYDEIKPKDKRASHCPFCDFDTQKERLLRENDDRRVFYPVRPIGWAIRYKKNLLLAPKQHHKYVTWLSTSEIVTKQEAEIWIQEHFTDEQYFSFMRHTDDIKSVQHLHYHYVVGQIHYADITNSVHRFDIENSN